MFMEAIRGRDELLVNENGLKNTMVALFRITQASKHNCRNLLNSLSAPSSVRNSIVRLLLI